MLDSSGISSPVTMWVVLFALGVTPLLILSCTSFLKFSIVFSVLRNCFGAPGVPSATTCGVLGIILTFYAMAPVFYEMRTIVERELGGKEVVRSSGAAVQHLTPKQLSPKLASAKQAAPKKASLKKASLKPSSLAVETEKIADLLFALERVSAPLKRFMWKSAGSREIAFFESLRASASKDAELSGPLPPEIDRVPLNIADPSDKESETDAGRSPTEGNRSERQTTGSENGLKKFSENALGEPGELRSIISEKSWSKASTTKASNSFQASIAKLAPSPGPSTVSRTSIDGISFVELLPAFVVSELTRGCTAGFLLLLPFLVIDIVVANVLLALGMSMLSPSTIAFPVKLAMFVLADGWLELVKALLEVPSR